jgi:hypothetical protein
VLFPPNLAPIARRFMKMLISVTSHIWLITVMCGLIGHDMRGFYIRTKNLFASISAPIEEGFSANSLHTIHVSLDR